MSDSGSEISSFFPGLYTTYNREGLPPSLLEVFQDVVKEQHCGSEIPTSIVSTDCWSAEYPLPPRYGELGSG